MADELQANLATYKLQLQQVEASLTSDSGNEDLLKLKKDLQEVIDLTEELIVNQEKADLALAVTQASEGASGTPVVPAHDWHVGDKCQAVYSEDGQYYNASIDEILDDGSCTITFEEYGNTDVSQVGLLKPIEESSAPPGMEVDPSGTQRPQTKKDLIAQQREYKRKKSQKKAQRMKQLEEERETEKNKWLSFNSKTFQKTNKGRVKKSIFATPDAVQGRVGVGTCGVGGKPMTSYTHQEKWKKQ